MYIISMHLGGVSSYEDSGIEGAFGMGLCRYDDGAQQTPGSCTSIRIHVPHKRQHEDSGFNYTATLPSQPRRRLAKRALG